MPASIEVHARPDPLRSHGAWIVLVPAVGAGALCGSERGVVLTGLFIGTVFAGGFLATGAWVVGLRRKLRQAAAGAVLAGTCLSLALVARDDWSFLGVVGFGRAAPLPRLGEQRSLGISVDSRIGVRTRGLVARGASGRADRARGCRASGGTVLRPVAVQRVAQRAHRDALEVWRALDRRKLRAMRESALHALWAGTAACGASWIG